MLCPSVVGIGERLNLHCKESGWNRAAISQSGDGSDKNSYDAWRECYVYMHICVCLYFFV